MSNTSSASKELIAYIGLGDAGIYGAYLPVKTPYGSTSSFFRSYDRDLTEYYPKLMDGGFVLDKSKVSLNDLTHHVVSGPICDLSLPPGSINRFMTKETESIVDPADARSMDYISLDMYVELCRRLRGVRIGKRVGNEIRWEDGEVERF